LTGKSRRFPLISGSIDDFKFLLKWLSTKKNVTYWDIINALYEHHKKSPFKSYFKKILLFKDKIIDNTLDSDISLLEILRVLEPSKSPNSYIVNNKRLKELLKSLSD